MKNNSLLALVFVASLSSGSASVLLKENDSNGVDYYSAYSIKEDGSESYFLFDDWEHVSAYFSDHFVIRERNRRNLLLEKAHGWLVSNSSISSSNKILTGGSI